MTRIGHRDSLRLVEGEIDDDRKLLKQKLTVTEREAEVLFWIARGKSNRDIAEILDLSPRTVNKHLEQIYASSESRTAPPPQHSRCERSAFANEGWWPRPSDQCELSNSALLIIPPLTSPGSKPARSVLNIEIVCADGHAKISPKKFCMAAHERRSACLL
jgi:DNA-binding CsgD family transcriptional regulator